MAPLPLAVAWREENTKTSQEQNTVTLSTARGQPFPTKVTTVYPVAINRKGKLDCHLWGAQWGSLGISGQCPDFPSQFLQDAVNIQFGDVISVSYYLLFCLEAPLQGLCSPRTLGVKGRGTLQLSALMGARSPFFFFFFAVLIFFDVSDVLHVKFDDFFLYTLYIFFDFT